LYIRALMENTSKTDDYKCEHGLSLYIETQKHRILFDTGASGLFAENAFVMGIENGLYTGLHYRRFPSV
jgi:7,8-dihydropterin-6-yl-methyl-4-(beta-D-ribofuranosyl)aminobenzene 5'-phosphate synthase